MTHRTRMIAVTAAVGLLALVGCSSDSDDSKAAETPPATEEQQGDAPLTAETVVDELSELYPLPNARDNSGSCNGADFGDDACVQLITTDAVSVYQLETVESAKKWADTHGDDAEQHGVFMLRWWPDEYPLDADAQAELSERMATLVD
ncbi:hypothetical protein ACWGNE_02395 [Streptomyces xiamenensis]